MYALKEMSRALHECVAMGVPTLQLSSTLHLVIWSENQLKIALFGSSRLPCF